MAEREPAGIAGLITPWNFPIAIPAWKAAPVLAYGNCVIMKHADLMLACAREIAAILKQAGCPDWAFNLVRGQDNSVGAHMVEHPGIDAIGFTGSVPTGRAIGLTCAERGRKVHSEMGGKNPMIVPDCADLGTAVDACLNRAFLSTGQRCTASSRLIVTAGLHDAFVAEMNDRAVTPKVGDALDPETRIGPVVNQYQLDQKMSHAQIAKDEGCAVAGGESVDGPGFLQRPVMCVDATNRMRISREEIFGPCASIINAADIDDAVAMANDTEFGLSVGICTTSLKHANHISRHSQAGMVMVNLPTAGVDCHVPCGGRERLSHGPGEQGSHSLESCTIAKTSCVAS